MLLNVIFNNVLVLLNHGFMGRSKKLGYACLRFLIAVLRSSLVEFIKGIPTMMMTGITSRVLAALVKGQLQSFEISQ
jgi:hypothetical protein